MLNIFALVRFKLNFQTKFYTIGGAIESEYGRVDWKVLQNVTSYRFKVTFRFSFFFLLSKK